jgi:hypothetical protein
LRARDGAVVVGAAAGTATVGEHARSRIPPGRPAIGGGALACRSGLASAGP